jgi:thymidylate kinase
VHLTEDEPPILRIDGKLHRTEHSKLKGELLKAMIYSVLTSSQKEKFEKDLEFLEKARMNHHRAKEMLPDHKIFIIDGTKSKDEVFEQIKNVIDSELRVP